MGGLSFKYETEWEFETSKDTSVSIFATYSTGNIILKSNRTGQKADIFYRSVSLSLSKGLPFGYSEADFKDPSKGDGALMADKYISSFDFDCVGYILSLGGTTGVFSDGAGTNGSSLNIILFGTYPFAALKCSGELKGTTPGAGVGGGLAQFALKSLTDK